jgi:hypothetical protein
MRRLLATAGLAGFMFGTLLLMGGPAGAASGDGCTGSATSFDGDNKQLDKASAPGPGGTKDNPFEVDPDGHVQYEYNVENEIAGGTWSVKLLGPVSFGDDISDDSGPSGNGDEPLESYLKPGGVTPIVGLIKADIEIKNKDGDVVCTYSGWIKIGGSVLTSPVFYLSIVFLAFAGFLGFLAMGEPV